jgi:hypothetical protein
MRYLSSFFLCTFAKQHFCYLLSFFSTYKTPIRSKKKDDDKIIFFIIEPKKKNHK